MFRMFSGLLRQIQVVMIVWCVCALSGCGEDESTAGIANEKDPYSRGVRLGSVDDSDDPYTSPGHPDDGTTLIQPDNSDELEQARRGESSPAARAPASSEQDTAESRSAARRTAVRDFQLAHPWAFRQKTQWTALAWSSACIGVPMRISYVWIAVVRTVAPRHVSKEMRYRIVSINMDAPTIIALKNFVANHSTRADSTRMPKGHKRLTTIQIQSIKALRAHLVVG